MDFIEPCFGTGHNLSLICQMTSEDIKHQLINKGRGGGKGRSGVNKVGGGGKGRSGVNKGRGGG